MTESHPTPMTLYTCDQVAEQLNIPNRSARELFNQRAVPLVRLGRRLYVRHADLAAFLDAATTQADGTQAER